MSSVKFFNEEIVDDVTSRLYTSSDYSERIIVLYRTNENKIVIIYYNENRIEEVDMENPTPDKIDKLIFSK